MPTLIQFFIRHSLIGFAISAAFVAAIAWFDVMGLGRLFMGSPQGLIGCAMLWFFCGTMFAGAQTGVALFSMHQNEDEDGPRGGTGSPAYIPAHSKKTRRRI